MGGLAVGEGQEAMFETLEFTTHMRADKPRYLMGVGKPADIIGGIARGIDMFDCVMPTRSGRTGQAFTRRGTVNMKMRVMPMIRARWMNIVLAQHVQNIAVLICTISLKRKRCWG